MHIQPITDRKTWEDFVAGYPDKTFTHSWAWGEFNAQTEDKIFRLGIYHDSAPVGAQNFAREIPRPTPFGVALVIKVKARRGTFLFCPHGPLLDWNEPEQFEVLIKYLKDLAKQEDVSFIRISPLLPDNPENLAHFKKQGFHKAPIHMHAETTWTLDLTPSEEEILANMRKNTRYYVRRGEKEGVTVEMRKDLQAVEEFYNIHKETVGRHHFTPFSLDYLKKQFEAFSADDQIAVFHAKFDGKILSSAIIPFYGDSAFYHHGASADMYTKVPSSYLLQWEIIREAKRRGCSKYNFWGIAPTDDRKHPWHGLSLFKTGFGGYRTDLIPAQDLKLNWKYYKAFLIDKYRHWKRGF